MTDISNNNGTELDDFDDLNLDELDDFDDLNGDDEDTSTSTSTTQASASNNDEFDLVESAGAETDSPTSLDYSEIQSSWLGLAIESSVQSIKAWYAREFNKSLNTTQLTSLRGELVSAALGTNLSVRRTVTSRLSSGIVPASGGTVVSASRPDNVRASSWATKSVKETTKLLKLFKIKKWTLYVAYTPRGGAKGAEFCYRHTDKKIANTNSLMCTKCKVWTGTDLPNNKRRVSRYLISGRMAYAKDFMNKSPATKFIKAYENSPEILRAFIWPTEWIYPNDLNGIDHILVNPSSGSMTNPEKSTIVKTYSEEVLFPERNYYIQRQSVKKCPKTAGH